MATRPASKLNLQEFGLQDEVELVDKQARQSIENMIDDTTTASTSTWSSEKIDEEIDNKSVTKEASGNLIEITDGASAPMVKCVTEIQGSQDLHGYDKPWVGGAGKNKLDPAYRTETSNAVRFYYGNAKEFQTGTYTFSVSATATQITVYDSNNTVIGIAYGANNITVTFGESTLIWVEAYYASGVIPSGGLSSINCQFESGSTATAYEPYSNICPITAYTEGEIEVRGKNLFDKNGTLNTGYLQEDGTISGNGGYKYTDYISIISNEQYYFYLMQGTNPAICWYDENKNFISGIKNGGASILTLQAPANAKYVRASILNANVDEFTIKKVDGDTTFTPYVGTTHTTTYPSAIYRGSEDVVKGEVRTDYTTVDLGDLTFVLTQDGGFYTDSLKGIIKAVNYSQETTTAVCSCYIATTGSVAANRLLDGSFGLDGVGRIYFYDTTKVGKTATEIKADLTGQTLAYELSTPATSSVTPTNLPIKSLSGYNHIESSTGDMEVEYITGEYQPIVDLIEENATRHKIVSQEEYDALPDSKNSNGILYFVN